MTTRSRTARSVPVRGGPRRRRQWWTTNHNAGLAVGESFVDLLQNLPETEQMGCTVTRIIMDMWYSPGFGVTSDSGMLIDIGIGIISEESFDASVMPDPGSNAEEPVTGWMYKARSVSRVDVTRGDILHGHLAADLRAQRKMGNRAKLTLITEIAGQEGATFTVRQTGLVRVLCLLP